MARQNSVDSLEGVQDTGIQVIRMQPEHTDQVAELERACFSMPWSKQAFLDALERPEALFFVSLFEDAVAGYCGIYVAADEGEITNVAVAEDCRRKGLAHRLVRKTMDMAAEQGARRIFLEVRSSNAPAISLYERLGFVTVGTRRGFYAKPTEDALVMRYDYDDKGNGSFD